jgi:hypothetical protein
MRYSQFLPILLWNPNMSNLPDCILTGCYFNSPLESKFVRGDLHKLGDCYIVTANTVATNNADWIYGHPPASDMVVSAIQSAYFERRGVIVFTTKVAEFNKRAEEYLTKWRFPTPTV